MGQELPRITDIKDLQGTRVFVRAGFNVPIKDGEIENDFRIRRVLPTISYLVTNGAKVIIGSHLWGDEVTSLEIIADYLSKSMPVTFAKDIAEARSVMSDMNDGEVVLLENLRYLEGEQENSDELAQELASLADIYVNEAFPVSHREHASIVGIPKYIPSYAGLQFVEEVENLTRALDPESPSLFIVGGAKFATKIPLIEQFSHTADRVYVAGALANAFFEAKGYDIGASLAPETPLDMVDMLENDKIILPKDVVVKNGDHVETKLPANVEGEDCMLDVGPESMGELEELIDEAAFILWNGPLGDYERGFGDTTFELARMIADIPADSVLGGGDTIAAITKLENEEEFMFVSTAGGAMLEFLAHEGVLPGITALKNH